MLLPNQKVPVGEGPYYLRGHVLVGRGKARNLGLGDATGAVRVAEKIDRCQQHELHVRELVRLQGFAQDALPRIRREPQLVARVALKIAIPHFRTTATLAESPALSLSRSG